VELPKFYFPEFVKNTPLINALTLKRKKRPPSLMPLSQARFYFFLSKVNRVRPS